MLLGPKDRPVENHCSTINNGYCCEFCVGLDDYSKSMCILIRALYQDMYLSPRTQSIMPLWKAEETKDRTKYLTYSTLSTQKAVQQNYGKIWTFLQTK